MIIALSYCRQDQDQAEQLLAWIATLGAMEKHQLWIVREMIADRIDLVPIAHEIVVTDDVAHKWPQSANHQFKKLGKEMEYSGAPQPFLYIEPDAIPMGPDAFDLIELEYRRAIERRRPFLGDLVSPPQVETPRMSGVGVYPGRLTQFAGEVYFAYDAPWDQQAARLIYGQMMPSKLIMHRWKAPPFNSWEEVQERIYKVKPECQLYHSDKSGSLIKLLRAQRGEVVLPAPPAPEEPQEQEQDIDQVDETHLLGSAAARSEVPIPLQVESAPAPQHDAKLVLAADPWADVDAALRQIDRLVFQLQTFCVDSRRTRSVRLKLHDAGVVQLGYRFPRKRGYRKQRK